MRVKPIPLKKMLVAKALSLTICLSPQMAAAQSGAFTLVRSQIDVCHLGPANCELLTETALSFAEVGSLTDIYAKTRAGFGVNGAFAVASNKPDYLGAFSESFWVDSFTIFGGTGRGTLNIAVRVDGTLTGAGQPGISGPNSFYALYFSESTYTFTQDHLRRWLDCPNSPANTCIPAPPYDSLEAISITEGFSGSKTFAAKVPFTYGKPVYFASLLGAEVLGNGISDFYGSAHFGATDPDGLAVTGESGTIYPTVTSVPEPSLNTLLLSGLLFIGLVTGAHRSRVSKSIADA